MDWNRIPDTVTIRRTMAGLSERRFNPILVGNGLAALDKLKEMIPAGAEVMTGGSTTLEEIGFISLLAGGQHPWKNWKDLILPEKDPAKQADLRRKSTTSEYFLGSLQAITEAGQGLGADATGSRQGGYVFSAQHVIWVVGMNKLVPDLDMAFRRLREHCFPMEDARVKRTGGHGTSLGKVVIYEREAVPGRITTILVNGKLGF